VPREAGIQTTTDLSRDEYMLTLVIFGPSGISNSARLVAFDCSISGMT
jgi:hypothetical protein